MKKVLHQLLSVLVSLTLLAGTLPAAALADTQIISGTTGGDYQIVEPQAAEPDADTVQIRFLDSDGTVLKTDTVAVGESYPNSSWPVPSHDGYAFEGWLDGAGFVTDLSDLQADATLTAQFVRLYTVTFENWDGTVLATASGIRAGTDVVAANYYQGNAPEREGFGFVAWEPQEIASISADATVTATYTALVQHTIVINYVYKNQKQAAEPFVAVVGDGYQFTQTVTSPAMVGYAPDQATVSITEPITRDYDIDVTYLPLSDTPYQLVHKQQDLTGGTYTVADTEQRAGETGSQTTVGEGDVKTYEGYSLISNLQNVNQEIAADGTTVVELLYDRQIHFVLFETADGTYIEPQVGLYGAAVTAPADPTRTGYTFAGWDSPIPATIGSTDVTITAKWTPQTVGYTIVVWRENANNTNYSYALTITGQTALAGSTVSTFNSALLTDTEAQYFTYARLDAVTVEGDGSSILNVYCTRNVYSAQFQLTTSSSGNYLTANGSTYYHTGDSSHIDYSFTAKYNSDITGLWPSYVGPDSVKFQGWSSVGASNLYTSKRLTFMPELLSRLFTATYNGDCKDTLAYMLETPDGTGTAYTYNSAARYYKAAANLAQVVYSTGGNWGMKEISGFSGQNVVIDITAGTSRSPTARNVTLYYTRNKYTLTFHNGNQVNATQSIFFEASIASYQYTPDKPAGVPEDYVFTGWYTDQNLYANSLFVWTGATMPVGGLILYAGWVKPSYPVVFELNYEQGGVYTSQQVIKGDNAGEVLNPTRAGYHFDYWYYLDGGVEKLFTFSMPITRAYDLYAHWTASEVGYTVRYVAAGGGAVYSAGGQALANKTGAHDVSTLVTEAAPAGFTSAGVPMYPDRLTSSVTLQADEASNVITFTYTAMPQAYYLVRYVDTNGAEIASQYGPVATSDNLVTVRYKSIAGYSPKVYQQTVVLAAEASADAVSQNIITFVYTPNSNGIYTVRYYLQNINDNGYTLDDTATVSASLPLGSTASAPILSYSGFTFVSGISVVSGVVHSDSTNPLALTVYYNRNLLGYSVSYLDADTDPMQRLTGDTLGTARYGRQVTLFAKDLTGYRLDTALSPSPATLTIGLDEAANHVNFYYHLRTDIVVTVRFLDENDVNIATSKEFTGATDRNVKLGETYAYTLLSGEKVIEYNGETYRHLSSEAETASLTIAEYGNYLDFHYVPDTYHVTYQANGGSGAPTDPDAHRANTSVAIAAGTPAYGEYRFEGWTDSLAVIGQVYETQSALSAITLMNDPFTMPKADVTLYAVWSHLTAVLTYACDTPYTGALPGAATVPVNTAATVAGGDTITRTGYTFAGWSLKNSEGQISGPLYGPGTANPTIAITTGTTLYATWTPVSYAITYHNNLPAAAQPRLQNPNTLNAYTVESPDFTLAPASAVGYTFTGWYTDSAYQTLVAAPALPAGSTGDRAYYAGFVTAPVDGFTVTGYTGTYDGQPHGVTFTDSNGQLLPTDTVTYSTPNAYTDVTNGPVSVTVTVTRDGVVIWTGTATVTIRPRTFSLTAQSINTVYDGAAHSLDVTVPLGEGGAVTTADAEAIRQSLVFTMGGTVVQNSFADAMPTTTVTVSATYPNYVILPATPTVTIGKRPVTLTADSLTGIVYDGLPHTVTTFTLAEATDTTGLVAGDTVQSVTMTDNSRTLVGVSEPTPAQAVMGVGNAENYQFTYQKGTLEIVKSSALTLTLSAGAGSYIFDGVAHGYTADSAGVPVTLEYRVNNEDWQTVTADNPLPVYTDVGEYPLTVRASNPNYDNQPTASATLTITPRDVTVRAGSASYPYDGQTHTVTAWTVDEPDATTGLIGTDTVTGVQLTGNSRSELGSNAITVAVTAWSTQTSPANYHVVPVDGSITITQNTGAPVVTADDLTLTYDGDTHRLSYTVTVPEGTPYTVYYRLATEDWTALPAGGLLPTQENAGVYAYSLKIESPNYALPGEDAATLTILPRAITFTAGTSTGNVYNGEPVSVSYTVSPQTELAGLLDGQTATAALVGTPQTETGTYAVTFDTAATKIKRGTKDVTANYTVAYADGLIGIVQAASQATSTAATFVYNATARAYTAPQLQTEDGDAIAGVTVAWSTTPLEADDAGWNVSPLPVETEVKEQLPGGTADAYRIYVRLSQPNYETKIVTASLTITPLPVTITADTEDNFPYTLLPDGQAKVWSVDTAHWQADGLAQDTLYVSDTILYTLSDNTESQVGDGHDVTFAAYTIANDAHAKNYRITPVNGHIRVVRGTAAAVLTGEDLTFVYDATAHTLPQPTVTVATEGGDPLDRTAEFTFTYTVTKDGHSTTYSALPTFTDAGEYTVKIKAVSDVYADPKAVTVTVTVLPRPLVLRSETASVPYDALAHSVTVLSNVTGYANGSHAVDASALTLLAGQVNTATLAGVYPVQIDPASVTVLDGDTDVTANYAVSTVAGGLTITPVTVTAAQLGLVDVTRVYDGQSHSLAMPETLALGTQTLDLTDTARFTFHWQALDLSAAGATQTDEAANPAYTNVSSHRVTVQVTDATGSLQFEPAMAVVSVTPRDVTITPDSDTFLYDGAEHAITTYRTPYAAAGEDTGLIGNDAVTVTLHDNRRTDAGVNTITWSDPVMTTGLLGNYRFLPATGTLTISAADALTLTLNAFNGVYDAREHGYTYQTNEPDATALTLSYSLDGVTFQPFTGVADLPVYRDAGSYPITLRASSPNFAAPATAQATLRIAPRPVSVTPGTASFLYDGTAKTLTAYTLERAAVNDAGQPVGTRGLLGTDNATVTLTNNQQTDAGNYPVGSENAQAVGDTSLANYTFDYGTGLLTILARDGLTITLTPDNAPYDGEEHGFTVTTNALGNSTLEASTDGGVTWTPFTADGDLPSRVNVGDTPLTVRVTNPNYTTPTATASATLTITPVDLTLTVVSQSFVFDGMPHSLTLTASGLVGGDTLGANTLNPPSRTDAGTETVQAVQGDTQIVNAGRPGNLITNYQVTYVTGVLTIVDFSLTGYIGVYDGGPHGVTVTVPDVFVDLYDVTYTVDGVLTADPPTFTDVGTHNVTVTLTPKDPELGLPTFSKDTTIVITARTVQLLADSINKTYDGAYSALTVTLPEGAAANQTDADTILANVTFTEGGTGLTNAFSNAGSKTVVAASTCPNYNILPVATTVQIAARPLTLAAGSATKAYDEQPVTVTYTYNTATYDGGTVTNATGLLKQHTLSATLLGATQTEVVNLAPVTFDTGLTAITEGGASVLGNYAVEYVPGTITITRAGALTLNLADYVGVYDAAAHGVSITSVMDGTRSVDPALFTWTYGLAAEDVTQTSLTRTDVSDQLVYVKGTSADGNYPDVTGVARLAITSRPVLVTPGSATYTYDGQSHTVTDYSAERAAVSGGLPLGGRGLIGTDAVEVTLENNVQTAPGSYLISWTNPVMTAGTAANYAFQHDDGWLTINKASEGLTISIADDTLTYDAQAHRLPYQVTAPVGTPYTVEYSVDNGATYTAVSQDGLLPVYVGAGVYPIKVRVTSPWYVDGYISADEATLTIGTRALNIRSESDTFVYDQAEHSVKGLWQVTATSANAGLVGGSDAHRIDTFTYATGKNNTQTDAGGHAVLVEPASVRIVDADGQDVSANYAVTTDAGRIEVTAQPTTMLATDRTETYNGQPYGFTLPTLLDANGDPVTEPVTYAYSLDGLTWSTTPITYENVQSGGYTIYIRAESPNYQPTTVGATLTIVAAPITVTADSNTGFIFTLDKHGDPVEWSIDTATLTLGTLFKGETLSYALSNNTQAEVGEHAVNLDSCVVLLGGSDVSTNYAVTLQNGVIGVVQGQADAYMTAEPLSGVYRSSDYTLTKPVISVQSNTGEYVDMTSRYNIRYDVTKDGSAETWNFTNTLPHFTDAGVYRIAITATSTAVTSPVTGATTMTIARLPITLSAGSNATAPYTYQGVEQSVEAYAITLGAPAGSDRVASYTFTDGLGNTATDVCDRAVELSAVTLQNGTRDVTVNYDITLLPGWLVIQPLTVQNGLTLTGETHVYDGGEHYATLSDVLTTSIGTYSLSAATTAEGAPRFAVRYTATPQGGAESAQSSDNPTFTNVTTQTVKAYVTDATGNFVILPAGTAVSVTPRDVTLTPDSLTVPYDGLAHSITTYARPKASMENGVALGLTGLVGEDDVTVTLRNNGPFTLPGAYTVTWDDPAVMTAGLADNYRFLHATGLLTITQASGIDLALTAENVVYDGLLYGYTAVPQVPENTPVTLAYQAPDGSWVEITPTSPLPMQTDAGDYPLTVRMTSPCYSDVAIRMATLHIAPRAITVFSGDNSAAPYTYTGAEQSVTGATVSAATPLAIGDSLYPEGNTFAPGLENTNTDACDRAVSLTGVTLRNAAGNPVNNNYAIVYQPGRIVIRKAASVATAATRTEPYQGVPYAFPVPVLRDTLGNPIAGVAYAYALTPLATEDEGWIPVTDFPTREDVKRAAGGGVLGDVIYVRLTHQNYATQTTTSTLTITPAPITVTADTNDGFVYTLDATGAPIVWSVNTATLTAGTLYKGATLLTALTNNTQATVGAHDVFVNTCNVMLATLDVTGNYSVQTLPGHIAVSRGTAESTITAVGDRVLYDGQPHGIPAPVVSVLAQGGVSINRTEDFDLRFEVTLAGTTDSWHFTDAADMDLTEAGVYTVVISATSDLHADPASQTVTLTIEPRPLLVQSGDNSATPYTYTGQTQSVAGADTVLGLLATDRLQNLTYEDGKSNEAVDVVDRAVLANGVTVMNGRRDVTANYLPQFVPGRLVILPLHVPAVNIPVKDVTAVYDGQPHTLTLPQTVRTDVGTLTLSEEFTVTYTDANGVRSDTLLEYTDVGAYPILVTLTSISGNYLTEPVHATVTVTPRPLAVAYGSLSVAYDGLPHTVPINVTGLVARDSLYLSEVNRTATAVTRLADGTTGALVTTATGWQLTDASDATINRAANYAVTVTPGSLEIKPLAITVTVESDTFQYDGLPHALTGYRVTGSLAQSDTVNVTLSARTATKVADSGPVGVDAATVTRVATGEDVTANYQITLVEGKLTITRRTIGLIALELTVLYDGLAHQPEILVQNALATGDTLAYTELQNMPQTDVGTYSNILFHKGRTLILNAAGENVTANYDVRYTPGRLVIVAPTTTYTVRYYYDGELRSTATLTGARGERITDYPPRLMVGYRLDHTENLPLTLSRNAADNVISVYYRTGDDLTTLEDVMTPLGGNATSYERGVAVD